MDKPDNTGKKDSEESCCDSKSCCSGRAVKCLAGALLLLLGLIGGYFMGRCSAMHGKMCGMHAAPAAAPAQPEQPAAQ